MKIRKIVISAALLMLLVPSTNIFAQTQGKPDFAIQGITVMPLQPTANQGVTIRVTGLYTGPYPYISTKGLNSTKKSFGDFYYDNTLPQGLTTTPSQTSPLNDGATFVYEYHGSFQSEGSKQLNFAVDEVDEVDEYNERNNEGFKTVDVFSANNRPNLSLDSAEASNQTVAINDPVTITVHGTYTGSVSLKSTQGIGSLKVNVNDFVSTSVTLQPQPSETTPLASGGTFTYIVIGSFTTAGSHTFIFTIDQNNELIESNEIDNNFSTNITVQSGGSTPPPTPPETPPTTPPTTPPSEDTADTWSAQEQALVTSVDAALTARLKGWILLQVQAHGEAWYVNPTDGKKYYMKDGAVAYQALRKFGLGITDADLAKIPVGDINARGTVASTYLGNRLRGRILLQVQAHGEAWYVNPADGKRYYMKDGPAAYQIMRLLSKGITNTDLRKIAVGILQ